MEETKKDLSKAFFEIKDIKMEEIDLSKFDGPKGMFAKTLSFEDFQRISNECLVLKKDIKQEDITEDSYEYTNDFTAKIMAASVCDSEGDLIFSEEQIPMIQKKSNVLFQTVSEIVTKMNKPITDEEVSEKAKK